MSVTASPAPGSHAVLQLQCTPTNIDARPSPLKPSNQSATLSASRYSVDVTPTDNSRSVVLPDAYYSVDHTQHTPPVRGSKLRQRCKDIACTLNFNSPSREKPAPTKVFNSVITAAISDCVGSFFGDTRNMGNTCSNSSFTNQRPTPIGGVSESSNSGLIKCPRPLRDASRISETSVKRPTPVGSSSNPRKASIPASILVRQIGSRRVSSDSALTKQQTDRPAVVGSKRRSTSLVNLVKLRRSISQSFQYTTHQTLAVL